MLYSEKVMKKAPRTKSRKVTEMAKEYRFDYKKAKPNRFASRMKKISAKGKGTAKKIAHKKAARPTKKKKK